MLQKFQIPLEAMRQADITIQYVSGGDTLQKWVECKHICCETGSSGWNVEKTRWCKEDMEEVQQKLGGSETPAITLYT